LTPEAASPVFTRRRALVAAGSHAARSLPAAAAVLAEREHYHGAEEDFPLRLAPSPAHRAAHPEEPAPLRRGGKRK